MTSLPEQLSAARKSQVEFQFDFFRAVTSQAFDSAGKLISLNLNTSRATVERSTMTIGKLFSITDPRELLALGAQTQEQFQSMVTYGRELLNIATTAGIALPRRAAASVRPALAPTGVQEQPAAVFAEETVTGAVAKTTLKPEAAPELASADDPVAKAKPATKALSKVAPGLDVAEEPVTAPFAVSPQHEIALPPMASVEAPPPARRAKQAGSSKASRRK